MMDSHPSAYQAQEGPGRGSLVFGVHLGMIADDQRDQKCAGHIQEGKFFLSLKGTDDPIDECRIRVCPAFHGLFSIACGNEGVTQFR